MQKFERVGLRWVLYGELDAVAGHVQVYAHDELRASRGARHVREARPRLGPPASALLHRPAHLDRVPPLPARDPRLQKVRLVSGVLVAW